MRYPGLFLCVGILVPTFASAQSTGGAQTGPVPPVVGARAPGADSTFQPRILLARPAAQQDTNPLTVQLFSRLESRLERNRNNLCAPGQSFFTIATCQPGFQPLFDFDFNLFARGGIGDRVGVAVDYDSRREFDASNNISIAYTGRPGEVIQRIEIGNVSFQPPVSRFITTGIPSGNYGVQAEGLLGPLNFRAIAAQQKGRVVQDQTFTIGDRSLRTDTTEMEDYRFEPRRFFFTVDPTQLGGYPNVDILNSSEMQAHAAALPDTIRPTQLYLYRVLIGGQPPNPNGPRFIARGARNTARGLVYEYLREGIDYYADPSLLWISLVRQLRRDERLVVAYNVLLPDGTTVYPPTGGTPDLEFRQEPQFANVLWDPELQPADSAFFREIRSAYRVAGEDLVRESVKLRIVTGPGVGQEKPAAGASATYLQMFGLAQPTSSAAFDWENRLWPRIGDPNFNRGSGGVGTPLVRDHFVVFPSLRPLSSAGLVEPGNPANDTLYTIPGEDIYSSRRPQSAYRMQLTFATEGGNNSSVLALGSIQVRRGSERLTLDGVPLIRDVDYQIDYDLGQVSFARPDTLFLRPRVVSVRFEENPLFAETPTSILALSASLPLSNGEVAFTAINQSQRSTFSRPILGFEPAASFVAGVNAGFAWEVPALTRALGSGAGGAPATPAVLRLAAELAMSRPNPNSRNLAYLESFQGQGGINVPISEGQWYFASQPIASPLLGETLLDAERASTLAWQNFALDANGNPITFRTEEIDPNVSLVGRFSVPEPLLLLTLYPPGIGGARNSAGGYDWTIANAPAGRRWRSIRALLSPSGADLTATETIDFAALIDTSTARGAANPVLVIDIGDLSENSFTFSPDTILVQGAERSFAGYRGRRVQGLDRVNSERDSLSRSFDAAVNDTGLPGDVALSITVADAFSGTPLGDSLGVRTCMADRRVLSLGDTKANCTIRNARLDEEDLDNDGVLNFPRASERLLRYVIDMSNPDTYDRIGGCIPPSDPRSVSGSQLCWVHFRIPFGEPSERIGDPLVRRMKTLRLTVVSGADAPDGSFTYLPLTRIRLTGAPWQKRSENAVAGIAGGDESGGGVFVSLIGTQDSSATLPYQPPPGVRESADDRASEFGASQVQVNELALRIRARDINVNERAEAFFRFPEGQKSFMGYEQLRVWARGRGSGWGADGELNFFLRVGRDANNFYLYRAPVNSGAFQSAWEPEIRADFKRWFALRAQLQDAIRLGEPPESSCSASDSALVNASGIPAGAANRQFACDGPYMIYTIDAAVSPPSLGAVQELSVGLVRVSEGGGANPIIPGDTLELWVDELRLAGVVSQPGYAGQISLELAGSGVAGVRVNVSRRDRNFRQLAEQPTFVTEDVVEVASTLRLDRLARANLGWALPLTISHTASSGDPLFITSSDIPGAGIAGLRTPRSARTTYSMTARRIAPYENGSLIHQILSGLALSGSYSAADNRSEYSLGEGNAFSFGAELNLARGAARASPPEAGLPAAGAAATTALSDTAAGTLSVQPAGRAWIPSLLRLSTGVSRSADNRASFLNPAPSLLDPGTRVRALEHSWRNTAALELRPSRFFTARMDVISAMDLRDYGDSTEAGRAALRARSSLFGADIGMERERGLRLSFNFAPEPLTWLRPRFGVGTRYSMFRDPNANSLSGFSGDAVDALPRRLGSSQQLTAGVALDFARLAAGVSRDTGGTTAPIFSPLDINFTRDLRSTYAAADFAPSLAYQLGIGGAGSFRTQDGRNASSAGLTNAVTAVHSIRPWRGASLTNRVNFASSHAWNGLLSGRVHELQADSRTFPDLSFQVNHQFAPAANWLRSAALQVGVRNLVRKTLVPAFTPGGEPDRSRDVATSYPASATLGWSLFGGFTTAASLNITNRSDTRPGLLLEGRTRSAGAEISKVFPAGSIGGLHEDLRTRLSLTSSSNKSSIRTPGSASTSRLLDNGRYSMAISAESDVSDTMVLSVAASQAVTYDRNLNRRFTQTLFTTVLSINFFSGVF